MLERASTCLESGSRQLLRAPTPYLPRGRPLLARHTLLWPATPTADVALPLCWPTHDVSDHTQRHPPPAPATLHAATRLDFLYPEKALAWLYQRAQHGLDGTGPSQPKRRTVSSPRVRHFSTTAATATATATATETSLEDASSLERARLEQARIESAKLLRHVTPVEALQKLVNERPQGKQELAWQLFHAIPEQNRTACHHRLLKNLLEFLAQDGDPIPSRALAVFDAIPLQKRRPSSFRIAIQAYAALRLVGPAIQLLEKIDARRGYDMLDIGIDRILERTVIYQQWDLSLRVFRTFLRTTPMLRGADTVRRQIRYGDTCPELWRHVTALPQLLDYLESFLQYVRQYKDEIKATKVQQDTLDQFTMTLLPNVMDHVLETENPDEVFISDWFTRLFDALHEAEILPTPSCYEYAILRMLALPRYQPYTNKPKIWLDLYNRYRSDYLHRVALSYRTQIPSQKLIARLIDYHTSHGGMKRVRDLVQDLRTFYPDQPLPPKLLLHLIHTFADRGEHEKVEEFLTELQTHYPGEVDLKVLSSRLTVHARRADVPQALTQFQRLQDEFGLTPDTTCWNTLLLAFVRSDDLDGALECFNACVDSGVQPDVYTFGPLLDFAAQRGDVEAFEILFSRARQMDVDLKSDIRARSGYVQCFLNAGDAEGATAIAMGMLKSWQAGALRGPPLTHTWNLLIQHHALEGDLAKARDYYRQMVENSIPLDSWTYGSLMRALVEVKQTNAAYKILRVTMPQHNYRVHGLHYAIVMSGFLSERQFDLAIDAQRRMMKRHVPRTPTTNLASLEVLGARSIYELNQRRDTNPKTRLDDVEAALEKMLVASTVHARVNREPESKRYIDPHNIGAIPQSYYGSLISLYTKRSAFAICSKLFREAQEAAPNTENYATPTTLTAAVMEALFKAGKYTEMDPIWKLALKSAKKLTTTFSQLGDKGSGNSDVTSLLDPQIQRRYAESRIANNRRQILIKPCRIYIRSLFARADPDAIPIATRTIRELLVNGFAIDNFTWNEYVQQLAKRNRLLEAFRVCEQYLMPRFPGWRNLTPGYVRHNVRGFQWMELRHYDIKGSSVLPRYKTLVLLAKAYDQVRSAERTGLGYNTKAGKWMGDMLDDAAPLTSRAIESMPQTSDELQERYLSGV